MGRLKEFCELIVDCEHNTAPTQDTGYPSIRTPNIGRGRLILDGVNRVSEETYRAWTQRAIPLPGDLILAREAPIGNVAIIPSGLKVCLGQRTVLIRADPKKLNAQYLMYLMLGDEIQGKIASISNGATVHHLNMKDIRELEMPPIPGRPIQGRIADILSAYDDLIENNTRRIRILEEMAQRIYREWFVHFRFPGHENVRMVESELGPIPEGWKVSRLAELAEVTMGQSPPSTSYNTDGKGLPFHQGVADFGSRFPNERIYCTTENRLAMAQDILLSVRAPVGRLNISQQKVVIGRGLSAIRSKSGRQHVLFQQLKEHFREEDSMGSGTIFKAVTKADVFGIKLIQADKSTAIRLDSWLRPVFREVEVLSLKNVILRATRDLLLPKLISGEISVDIAEEAMASAAS